MLGYSADRDSFPTSDMENNTDFGPDSNSDPFKEYMVEEGDSKDSYTQILAPPVQKTAIVVDGEVEFPPIVPHIMMSAP